MRTEQEMMDLILETARQDSRVLAAYLKGSRANGNVPKDVYQDFDIMYVVKEVAPFRKKTCMAGRVRRSHTEAGAGRRFRLWRTVRHSWGLRQKLFLVAAVCRWQPHRHWRGNPGNHGAEEEPQPPVCAFVG